MWQRGKRGLLIVAGKTLEVHISPKERQTRSLKYNGIFLGRLWGCPSVGGRRNRSDAAMQHYRAALLAVDGATVWQKFSIVAERRQVFSIGFLKLPPVLLSAHERDPVFFAAVLFL